MKLIEEIIDTLSSNEPNLHTALFKTKVLLHRLGEKELVEWVNFELQGYKNIESLPSYRKIDVTVMGNISNAAYHYSNQPLPLAHLDKQLRYNLTFTNLMQSIAVIEDYSTQDENLSISIAPELYPSISKGLGNGYVVVRAWGKHSVGGMLQVVTEVKSRLLDFVLELSERIPEELGKEEMKEASKKAGVSELFNNTIIGDNATFVIGDGNTQKIHNNIIKNDFESLAKELQKYNVENSDIQLLKEAIESSKDSSDGFGVEVNNWLAMMLGKAASTAWDVEVGIAGSLLASAISSYYGLF